MEELSSYIQDVKDQQSAAAFYKIVQAYEARVFTLCYRIIGNREEAEEAAQDVFLSCFKNIRSLEDHEKFTQWVLRIAYHKSIDYIRKKKIKYVELDRKSELMTIAHEQSNEGKESSLNAYLSLCDENEKAILILYYQEDMAIKEIAETLNMSNSNVKIKLFRARNKIKTHLDSISKIKKG